jgi:site-specific recombinase XerD
MEMGSAITRAETVGGLVPVELVERARDYAAAARAENTRRAYRSDWRAFASWCQAQGLEALPAAPETVALYLTDRATASKVSTITRALAAIAEGHRAAGLASPRGSGPVKAVLSGIRRTKGSAPAQKAPISTGGLRAMLAGLPEGLLGLRDRALLLVGFAGAFRRSELVGLAVEDVAQVEDGLEVTLRRSKTDQEAQGRKVGLPFGSSPASCPVRAFRAWVEAAGISTGPAFRSVDRHGRLGESLSPAAVALVVKRSASLVGLEAEDLAGHSLRAGLATAAAKAGKSERAIMAQTGHKSAAMVRRYIRDASLFSENAAAGLL